MASAKKQTLETQLEVYIHQAVTEKVKNKPCTAIALLHVDGVNRKEEIHSIGLAGHQSATDLAELFRSRAETHASGQDEKQKYELVFFYDTDKPQRPYVFYVTSEIAYGSHGVEEATAKGMVKGTQHFATRALELAFAQINTVNEQLVAGTTALMDASTRQLKIVNDKLEATTDERDVAIRMLVQQQVVQESKEHEHRMKELEKQSDNEMKRNIMTALPALANTVTQAISKKNVFPEASADSALLKMLLNATRKMDPQFVMGFMGQLDEATQAILASRGEQLMNEEKEAAQKRADALALASGVVKQPELTAGKGTDK